MSSFTITVTSGAFPTNTVSEFSTQLPRPLQLESEMEVALAYIQAPARVHNVPRGQNRVTITGSGDVVTEREMAPASYQEFAIFSTTFKSLLPNEIKLTFDRISKKSTFVLPAEYGIRLDYALSRVLGFSTAVDVKGPGSFESDSEYNMMGDYQTIFLHSSLVKGQVVDNQTVPLLSIVPTKAVTDGSSYSPSRLLYRPVAEQELDLD